MKIKPILILAIFFSIISACNSGTKEKQESKVTINPFAAPSIPIDSVIREAATPEKKDSITATYIYATNKKFTVKVMQFNYSDIRYYCWNKPNSIAKQPDLILTGGVRRLDSTKGGQFFTFQNKEYKYEIDERFMGETIDGIGIFLSVLKDEAEIHHSKLFVRENLFDSTYTVQHTDKFKTILNYCSANWNRLYREAGLNPSYVNSVGIQGRYRMLKSKLGIAVLESFFDENVFNSGQGPQGMDYYSMIFGRYNHRFLAKLYMELSELYLDEEFVHDFQKLYNTQLKKYLRTYYLSYSYAANNEKYVYDYSQEVFREFAEGIEKEGYNIYEGFVCPGFWVRRSIGGTSNDFFKLLTLTLETFDRDFLLENRVKEIKLFDPNKYSHLYLEAAC